MNFQAKLKQIRELAGLDENVKSLLEKMTGKELVSYEGIDALVAALMTFYNGELKKKISVTEFNEKFKNFCPFPVGSVLQMWNETNPTSLYLGTTWELISAGKYVKTGDRALQTGGSNSVTLTKDNLPNTKVSIDTFSVTVSPHYHNEGHACWEDDPNAFGKDWTGGAGALQHRETTKTLRYRTSTAGGGSTSTASPQTSALGNGTAITIQPEYITLKYWKRTS